MYAKVLPDDQGIVLNKEGNASIAGNGINDWDEYTEGCTAEGGVCGKAMNDYEYLYYPETDSRQFTFFFALFVLFQITNMLASRKIHDEFNIFAGICDNFVFIFVWLFIVVLQVVLTQFAGTIFEVHQGGLVWQQWIQALIIALTQFICDFIVKFIPDRATPAMGADSVFNVREEAAGRPRCTKFDEDDEKKGADDEEKWEMI